MARMKLAYKGTFAGVSNVGDIVGHEGTNYICRKSTSLPPPNPEYWQPAIVNDPAFDIEGPPGESIKGDKGAPGKDGESITGPPGRDGAGFSWKSEWRRRTDYVVNDVVESNGSAFVAVSDNRNSEPPSDDWELFVARGEQGPEGAQGIGGPRGRRGEPGTGGGGGGEPGPQGPKGDKGDTGEQGPQGEQGETGPQGDPGTNGSDGAPGADGLDGAPGAYGGAVTIQYTFDDATADSDPGSGNLRLSNATQNVSTVIRVDPLDSNGADWGTVIGDMANVLTDETGFVRIVNKADQTKWLLFFVSQVNPESGYYNLFATPLASSEASPFANGDPILLCYSKNGVPGADGSPGTPGADGSDATVPDVQVFIASGTWTKPAGAVTVDRYLIGGGGGGGSGRCGAASSNRPGGGGGGGGGYSHDSNPASEFGSSETVTVGAGGTAGAGVTTTSDGNAGSAGGNSSMTATGTGGATLTANGGGGGGGGTTSIGGGAAGSGGTGTTANGAAGGAGTFGAAAFDGGESSGRMAGGGGGGATGINASNTVGTYGGYGGASGGGRTRRNLSLAANAASGAQPIQVAADGGDGQCIIAGTTPVAFGGAGGGGGATCLQFATNFVGTAFGGRGGRFGGGGGGGAGYTNNVTVSNDGFPGGDGVAIIVTAF